MKQRAQKKAHGVPISGPARRFPPPSHDALRLSLPYRIPDPALDPNLGRRGHAGGKVERLSDGIHYHVDMDGAFAGSHYEFCVVGDGFVLTSAEIDFDTPTTLFASFPDTLRVYVASNGDGESVFSDGYSLSLKAPSSAVIVEPMTCGESNVTAMGHMKYVCVFLHRAALQKLYGGREDELPAVLQTFVNGDLKTAVARAVPLSSCILRCLEDVHSCQLRGQRRLLYMQSKAVEIVCQAIEAFEQDNCSTDPEATKSMAGRVLKAQRILASNFVSPPSLSDLAREVGMSRTALCTGFRQILGQSVFDYIEDLRMQQALALLNDHRSTVTQIAHAVGYNHSSSFSVAIHRRFGATPSELRRRTVLPPV